ncbi:hypothetical protein BJ508DRAFT_308397 [Ascobolus immersus RN42]|uniref:Uncharacterized protein n=1 Tax=Ascobolus immersus RN42 TaxID=1160509 RepID=A0A3N4I5M2_ASCIM|nr:hypothetical protein BJ508DRAFT_308397 [Ascobolus immersus RN42]
MEPYFAQYLIRILAFRKPHHSPTTLMAKYAQNPTSMHPHIKRNGETMRKSESSVKKRKIEKECASAKSRKNNQLRTALRRLAHYNSARSAPKPTMRTTTSGVRVPPALMTPTAVLDTAVLTDRHGDRLLTPPPLPSGANLYFTIPSITDWNAKVHRILARKYFCEMSGLEIPERGWDESSIAEIDAKLGPDEGECILYPFYLNNDFYHASGGVSSRLQLYLERPTHYLFRFPRCNSECQDFIAVILSCALGVGQTWAVSAPSLPFPSQPIDFLLRRLHQSWNGKLLAR